MAQFPQQNPNPVLRADETGQILYANPAAQRVLAALGAAASGPLPPPLRGLALEAFGRRASRRGRDLRRRTAGRIWFTAVRPKDEPYVNLYAHDVTKRAQAERALRDSENKFRGLFESMTEGFALHEIVTDEAGRPVDYRFLDINPAFERLTGLRRAEVLGRGVRES